MACGMWQVKWQTGFSVLGLGYTYTLPAAAAVAFVISINGLRASSCCSLKKGTSTRKRKSGEWGDLLKATAKGLQKSIY